MVSGPDNQLLVDRADNQLMVDEEDYLGKKWTYQEYEAELEKRIDPPNPDDPDDPRYYKKYAHNIPPPAAYFIIPERKDCVATNDKNQNDRRVYDGWDNLTQYERNGMQRLKDFVTNSGVGDPPPSFTERDWLKWIQASFYDEQKAGEKLVLHINWLRTISPNPRLKSNGLRLLQTGAFYLHGRDKYYRPAFIMDGRIMGDLAKKDPDLVTPETFQELYVFMFNYCKKVLFLPGQVEQWVTICDLNNMGVTSIPRKQLLAIGQLCQANFLYFLYRSFYTHVGWGQRALYKGVSAFIDAETKLKIQLFGEGAPQAMVDLFHPCQLEKRFGGTCETPTNYWPPHIGKEFIPQEEVAERHKLIRPDEYDRIISENPGLMVHPQHMSLSADTGERNQHWCLPEATPTPQPMKSSDSADLLDPFSAQRLQTGSMMTSGTMREGSIYHDAYTGLEELEEQMAIANQMSTQITSTALPKGKIPDSQAPTTAPEEVNPLKSPGSVQTSHVLKVSEASQQTMQGRTIQTLKPGQINKNDPAYDVMQNLPEAKSRKNLPGDQQQEACCKCTIF